jgi:hypothetical protein
MPTPVSYHPNGSTDDASGDRSGVRLHGRIHRRPTRSDQSRGVKVVKGRGWYGLRRVAADLAEALRPDARVKNALGGRVDSETRIGMVRETLGDDGVTPRPAVDRVDCPDAPERSSKRDLVQP